MPTELLYVLTLLLPGLWGWGMHWLLNRVWPLGDLAVEHHDVPSRPPVDYQI